MNDAMKILAVMTMIGVGSLHAQNANLTVVHGVPELPDDVTIAVDGADLFSFGFGDIEGPLALPPGDYFVEVKLAGSAVLSDTITLESGQDYSAVAHQTYNEGGAAGLALSLFRNETSVQPSGRARLTIRHVADAPAVDLGATLALSKNVRLQAVKAIDVANNEGGAPESFGAVDVPVGDYVLDLYANNELSPLVTTPATPLQDGISYVAYAVGSLEGGSFTLLLQTINL